MEEKNFPNRPPVQRPTPQRVNPPVRREAPQTKKKKSNDKAIMLVLIILAVVVVAVIFLWKGCSKSDSGTVGPDGTYYIDDYTAYEFDGKNKGALCLGNTTRYLFDYTIEGDSVFMDFEDVSIPDVTYTYELDGDTLTVKNSVSGPYVMTKRH